MMVRKNENTDYRLSHLRSFSTIAEALGKTNKIEEIWMVQEGGSNADSAPTNNIYNIFSFRDFNEVLEKLKPDLVIAFGGNYEYLERSMIKAAQSRGISSATVLSSVIESWVASSDYVPGLFSGRLHALRDHGMNIIKKYLFMLRTLYHAGYGLRYILRTIIKDAYLPFTSFSPIYTFGGADLNIISTPEWAEKIIKSGVDEKKVVVTGDCSMDSVYQQLASSTHSRSDKKIPVEILFITSPMVEHGYWKPAMRKEVVSSVVRALSEQSTNKVNLRVKIHPKTERLDVYKEILSPINPNIEIIQTANLLDLINDSDMVISFCSSSALIQALLLNKPIFIMNIFNEDINRNIYLKEDLAIECKTVESLLRVIHDVEVEGIAGKDPSAFIEKTFYRFDGKCSERAAEALLDLLYQSAVQR
jgi:hypothetical protein